MNTIITIILVGLVGPGANWIIDRVNSVNYPSLLAALCGSVFVRLIK